MVGTINYGGRVTDDKDQRLIRSLLKELIGPEVMEDSFCYQLYEGQRNVSTYSLVELFEYIERMPDLDKAYMFHFSPSLEIIQIKHMNRYFCEEANSWRRC